MLICRAINFKCIDSFYFYHGQREGRVEVEPKVSREGDRETSKLALSRGQGKERGGECSGCVHKSVYLHAAAVISALHKEIVLLSLPFVVPFVAYCCHSLSAPAHLPPAPPPLLCC